MPLTSSYASQAALLFPTGGTHWPAMGADFDQVPVHQATFDRADAALVQAGARRGQLRELMNGEGQSRRALTRTGWNWVGDFPMTMAAQTAVSVVIADAFERQWGPPALVLGESMGECAACAVAGALSVEDAVCVAFRWGRALAEASDVLSLRMAVVEDLEPEPLARLCAPLQARVVVDESRTLVVVSIPIANLPALQQAAGDLGASVLVSSNACVAHDPRLRQVEHVWRDYDAFVRGLRIRAPNRALLSALVPGERLLSAEQVRADLLETTSTPVRWRETVALLPGLGICTLVQPCAPIKAYALEKLRSEDDRLAGVRIQSVRTLEGVLKLGRARASVPPAPPAR